jgi:GH25 family lysozyme M1 (1,4-beta-N-acetylmuramidase)
MPATLDSLLEGIDNSHWDGLIRWLEVDASQLVNFAINKCTQGTTIVDSQYANNLAGCVLTLTPNGAYHFFETSKGAVDQAKYMISKLGMPKPKVLVNDLETIIAQLLGVPKGADAQTWVNVVSDTYAQLSSKAGSKKLRAVETRKLEIASYLLSGSLVEEVLAWDAYVVSQGYTDMLYTSPGFAGAYLHDERLATIKLWIANTEVNEPNIPWPWSLKGRWPNNPDVWIWQYRWDGVIPGIDAAVDMNKWRGTADEIVAFFGNGSTYPKPGGDPVNGWKFKVLTNGLSIRTGPGIEFTKVGSLAAGTIVVGTELKLGVSTWVKHSLGWSAAYYYGQGKHMEPVIE